MSNVTPPELVPKDAFITFDYWVNAVTLPVVAALGTLGNMATLRVVYRSLMWRSIRVYLIALSLWDIVLLLCAWWLFSLMAWHMHDVIVPIGYDIIQFFPIAYMLANMSFIGHLWTTLALTIERYMALCHPLRHLTAKRSKLMMASLLTLSIMLSLAFGVPRFFEVSVAADAAGEEHPQVWRVDTSALHGDTLYRKWFRMAGSVLFTSVGPILALCVLTLRMACTVKRGMRPMGSTRNARVHKAKVPCKARSPGPQRQRAAKKLSNPLLNMLIMSSACYLLPMVVDLIEFTVDDPSVFYLQYLVALSNTLITINASMPFFVYMLSSTRFRAEAAVHLNPCSPTRRRTPFHLSYQTITSSRL